jgi:hypothetical protein
MEALTETEEFSAKHLKDINCCRIYLRVFYISDISTHNGQGLTYWARKGRSDGGRKSSWAWPVQQRPILWKAWKLALDYLAKYGCVVPQLVHWLEQLHQQSEWYLDAEYNILYHHSNGTWGLLHLRYIHPQGARNYRFVTEGKAQWRKEFVLGMASSTAANIVESMETGTRLLSKRWLCCTAIGTLA